MSSFHYKHFQAWEKSKLERLIRTRFPKGTDFTFINDNELQNVIDIINNVFRPKLNYLSTNEVYNIYVSS